MAQRVVQLSETYTTKPTQAVIDALAAQFKAAYARTLADTKAGAAVKISFSFMADDAGDAAKLPGSGIGSAIIGQTLIPA